VEEECLARVYPLGEVIDLVGIRYAMLESDIQKNDEM